MFVNIGNGFCGVCRFDVLCTGKPISHSYLVTYTDGEQSSYFNHYGF